MNTRLTPERNRSTSESSADSVSEGGRGRAVIGTSAEKNAHALRSYTPILYVLFLEFLAISLTKSIVPKLLVDTYGSHTYFVVGVMETVKGILAFLSCPAIGKLSDRIGRKPCLLITVVGTYTSSYLVSSCPALPCTALLRPRLVWRSSISNSLFFK
jgi:MFS family permease